MEKIMPTNIIGIVIGIVVVIAIAGYLWWAWSQKKWPFSQ
jgi:uncharacterized membrane protein YccC